MPSTHSVRTIADLGPGDHLCCLYETEEERRAVLTPFLRQGLEQGEKVAYIVDARTAETVLGYLRDDGLAPRPYLARGQLVLLTRDDAYMREGVFDPEGMIALLRAETEQALAEGYPALRVTGEMTWALRGLAGSERLIEYEAKLNEFFPGSQCLAICQYDRRRFDPAVLLDVLYTHPIACVGAEVYDNSYYIPPAELLGHDVAAAKLRRWVQNLAERKRVEESGTEHTAELELMQRVYESLTRGDELNQVLQLVAEGTRSLFVGHAATIYFLDDDRRRLLMQKWTVPDWLTRQIEKLTGLNVREIPLPLVEGGHYWRTIEERRALLIDDPHDIEAMIAELATKHPALQKLAPAIARLLGYRSVLIAPLVAGGRVVGVMDLGSRKRLSEDDRLRFERLAAQVGLAIERARLYNEVKASRDYFRVVVNALHDQVLVIDRDYCISDVNAAFLRQTGHTRQEVIGRHCYEVTHQRSVPCNGPGHPCPARQVWESGEPARTIHVHYDREGKETYIDVAASPVRDAAGRVTGVIEAYRDVTAEHQLEEKLSAVHALGRELVLSRDEDQIAQAVMDVAERVLEFRVCGLWLVDEEGKALVRRAYTAAEQAADTTTLPLDGERGITVAVTHSGKPIYLPDVQHDPRYIDGGIGTRSELCVPLKVGEKIIGVLNAESEELDAFDQADLQLLSTLADQAALAIENARLFESVRQQRERVSVLAARLAEAEEAERRRLAQELHDQVGQNLTALGINLNIVRTQMPEEAAAPARSRLDDSLALVEQMTERIRGVMADLRPPVLDDYGLVAALHWYSTEFASRTGISVTVQGEEPVPRLAPPVENALFRIAQEALTNVARHAQATRVTVMVAMDDEAVRLLVADDGIGFDPARPTAPDGRPGWGLITMTERAEAVGGRLRVESAPGEGTRITVEVPR